MKTKLCKLIVLSVVSLMLPARADVSSVRHFRK